MDTKPSISTRAPSSKLQTMSFHCRLPKLLSRRCYQTRFSCWGVQTCSAHRDGLGASSHPILNTHHCTDTRAVTFCWALSGWTSSRSHLSPTSQNGDAPFPPTWIMSTQYFSAMGMRSSLLQDNEQFRMQILETPSSIRAFKSSTQTSGATSHGRYLYYIYTLCSSALVVLSLSPRTLWVTASPILSSWLQTCTLVYPLMPTKIDLINSYFQV
jgi:hypothetical protein